MKKNLQLNEMDLQLFAEGAGGADGGASGSEAAGVTAGDAGQQNTGVESGAAQQTASADAGQESPDPAVAFEALIKGQYKDQFNASVKKIVDGRVSGLTKQLQGYQAGNAVFEILAQKYGLDPTDYAGIAKAAENDKSFVEQEAMETGKDPQDLLQLKKIQRENENMRRQMEFNRQQQEEDWQKEAKEVQKVYPGMDLATEINNPDFARLLRSGVPMKVAYEVTHMNDIMGGAMQYAAQRAAKQVTDNVIAGAARPAENGTGAQGAASVKVDVSKLTSKEIKKYRERAASGERITFA